ncbi:Helix-turn-helix domain protein [compost metagenome]|jgi:predicted transcriptional regulator/DNA-binding XRE family transcriptional regulator|uniref:XRE family transcriptional regulator n=2 Tax=Agrobacterium TaxID=357 RepID=A0ABD5LL26_AGRRD|nr:MULTISPECIES: XRE family transcriptional regulator [Agrobacterium tumefaciens complex]MCP2137052.1 putative transcriptional regulator/DNA-binding XRE family transcriptional regulator [Rhizobium sp. SLBN-94]TGE79197.1 XRE family transcriptional regulator [Rhizobium sp. SEMIA 439]EHH02989.1 transcriptional regulator [Agrobacterium tumefaciens CCNWGS0286]EPR08782.1 Cro/Cl family transcriptional regulator [Agrobacterium radiobacter DSM 30147]KAB0461501.1 XRE family transcriptional regulator [Ag
MATEKLFIGRKVRGLRENARATQAQFAERLGISASYLNQIENNQRPVSASVLVTLVEKFQLDMAELATGESDRLVSAVREALKDPLFMNYEPGLQELKLIAQNAPGFAHALLRAHQAYRQNSEQLVQLDDRLGRGTAQVERTPYEEVRDFFHFVDNYVAEIDLLAEELAEELEIEGGETYGILAAHLRNRYGIHITRTEAAGGLIRHFDPAGKTLALSSYMAAPTRCFQLALQIAQLHAGATVDRVLAGAGFRNVEAAEICRIGLHNYFAAALILPYGQFHRAAQELRHDLELLAVRFGASLEQVAHRLSTLQRPGMKGVPIFFAKIDRAGNITKRHSATRLQFARFGAACPLWNIHQAFESSDRIVRQLAETPDGVRYLSIATQIEKAGAGFDTERPRYAIALGCEISHAQNFVYADTLDLGNAASFKPIGISCRVCERVDCVQRAVPPLKRKLHFDHLSRGALPYRIADF